MTGSPPTSAGLLVFREPAGSAAEVFLAHMGGPFWAHRDEGAWSIPKGLYDAATEEPWAAAQREFVEEIGTAAPPGEVIDLGECVQPRGKVVRTYAIRVAADCSLAFVSSNEFELEWPRGSGVMRWFPEVDGARWFTLDEAASKVLAGQVPILAALQRTLRG